MKACKVGKDQYAATGSKAGEADGHEQVAKPNSIPSSSSPHTCVHATDQLTKCHLTPRCHPITMRALVDEAYALRRSSFPWISCLLWLGKGTHPSKALGIILFNAALKMIVLIPLITTVTTGVGDRYSRIGNVSRIKWLQIRITPILIFRTEGNSWKSPKTKGLSRCPTHN